MVWSRSQAYLAVPPGETIKEQLEWRKMTQKEFAARMGMSQKHISKLINGEVHLTPEMAVKLEMVLGVHAYFWNGLEAIYREDLAKVEAEDALDADADTARTFPYSEIANLGWVPKTRIAREKAMNLRKYFEVVELSLLSKEQITHIACRRLDITEKGDMALLAWAQKAKLEAREIQTASVDIKGMQKALPKIREIAGKPQPELEKELKECLAGFGIALVFLPRLKGLRLHGAAFADGNKIVLGMVENETKADKFSFDLFHELAHIALGHVNRLGGTTEEDEKAADAWAKEKMK